MARNTNVSLPANTVTQLTDADVSGNIVFENRGKSSILVVATTDSTPPTEAALRGAAIEYGPGKGEVTTLAALFPGLTNPVRLWAFSNAGGSVFVSHG